MYFSFFFLQNVYKAPKMLGTRKWASPNSDEVLRRPKGFEKSDRNKWLKTKLLWTPKSPLNSKLKTEGKLSVWLKFEECEDGDGSGAESESSIRVSLLETAPSQVRTRISFLRSWQPRTGTSRQTGFFFFFSFQIVWCLIKVYKYWILRWYLLLYLPFAFQSLLWN